MKATFQFCQQLCRTGRSTVIIVAPLCNLYQQILSEYYICRIKLLYTISMVTQREGMSTYVCFLAASLFLILLFKSFANQKNFHAKIKGQL